MQAAQGAREYILHHTGLAETVDTSA